MALSRLGFQAGTRLIKLHRLQGEVTHATVNVEAHTGPWVAFIIQHYAYLYVTIAFPLLES